MGNLHLHGYEKGEETQITKIRNETIQYSTEILYRNKNDKSAVIIVFL